MSYVEKNLSTEETRRFWAHAEKKAEEVAKWPAWKKVGIAIAVPETDRQERGGDPPAGADGSKR